MLLALSALGQGYPPEQAAGKMTVPEGFHVDLVAGEPMVRQPVAIEFDDRGRLWVMQYLQYPNPAGLKRVQGRSLLAHRFTTAFPSRRRAGPRGPIDSRSSNRTRLDQVR